MDILQFSRSKRSNVSPSNEDISTILKALPRLMDNSLGETMMESNTNHPEYEVKKAEWDLFDSHSKDIANCSASVFANMHYLSFYLAEDSKDIINQLLDNKLIDPYVQCVALSVINQLNRFDVENCKIIFTYMNGKFLEDQSIIPAWTLVKRRLTILTDIEYFNQ